MATNPTNVSASFPVLPPVFNLPFGQVQDNGQVYLTPAGMELMQVIWAAIQGSGGLVDQATFSQTTPTPSNGDLRQGIERVQLAQPASGRVAEAQRKAEKAALVPVQRFDPRLARAFRDAVLLAERPPIPPKPATAQVYDITLNTAPATPSAGLVTLGVVTLGGLEVPAYQGAHGSQRTLQPHVGRGNWGMLSGNAGSTNQAYSGGFTSASFNGLGTPTSQSFASTNYGTMQPRIGYVSAATSGSIAGFYTGSSLQYFTVGGSNLGGGTTIARFMFGDSVSAPLAFLGVSTLSTTPSATTDPSTLTNCIGIGVSQTVTNPSHLYLFYGGSTAQAPIDLGANFPANTSNTDFYELIISSDPITGQTGYTVNRYTNSVVPAYTVSGLLTNTTPGTTLPASSSSMGVRAWRSNNTTAAAVTLAVESMFLAAGG
jgi:hypothetical protein